MIPASQKITIYKGVDFYFQLTWKDSTETAIPITGWTVQCDVRKSPTGDVEFSLNPEITDGAAGEVTMELTKTETDALTAGRYRYDLVFTTSAGERVGPLISGPVVVTELNSQL
jgi:hypothetical protein